MMHFLRTDRVLSVVAVENLRYFPTPFASFRGKNSVAFARQGSWPGAHVVHVIEFCRDLPGNVFYTGGNA
jgi:hypothetical protein